MIIKKKRITKHIQSVVNQSNMYVNNTPNTDPYICFSAETRGKVVGARYES